MHPGGEPTILVAHVSGDDTESLTGLVGLAGVVKPGKPGIPKRRAVLDLTQVRAGDWSKTEAVSGYRPAAFGPWGNRRGPVAGPSPHSRRPTAEPRGIL